MDVKRIREDFQAAFPAYMQKEVEMDKQRQDMNKKYVEMHLMVNKYLVEPEEELTSVGGTKKNLYNLLNSFDGDQPPLGSTEDLDKQLE